MAVSLRRAETELRKTRKTASGFSLIEMLLCITLVALVMLPFTLVMTNTSQSARGAYLQSTRSILLNSLRSELTPSVPNYATLFTDSSKDTSLNDAGQTIPYQKVVDTTTASATTAMKRTTLLYLYNNSSDASSAARYKATVVDYPKIFRMHFGNSNGIIDSLNRYWLSDNSSTLVYNSSNKVPGWQGGSHTATDYYLNDILNTSNSTNDDRIFQAETREVNTITYAMNVENGAYTVKIYFCETNPSDTGTKRAMDISLEGVQMNTDGPYSPYISTGSTNRGEVKMYDTVVSDGVLNITISANSIATDKNPNPHAIEVIKRPI